MPAAGHCAVPHARQVALHWSLGMCQTRFKWIPAGSAVVLLACHQRVVQAIQKPAPRPETSAASQQAPTCSQSQQAIQVETHRSIERQVSYRACSASSFSCSRLAAASAAARSASSRSRTRLRCRPSHAARAFCSLPRTCGAGRGKGATVSFRRRFDFDISAAPGRCRRDNRLQSERDLYKLPHRAFH